MIKFEDWLSRKDEVSTSTADVAQFVRPIGGVVKRAWPQTPKPMSFSDWRADKEQKIANTI